MIQGKPLKDYELPPPLFPLDEDEDSSSDEEGDSDESEGEYVDADFAGSWEPDQALDP